MNTYRKVYEEGRAALTGVPDGDLDARLLIEHVCGTDLTTLLADPERAVTDVQEAEYRALIARRAAREPLAYILGRTGFMGLTFAVDGRVLIPEQDTENLAEEALRSLHDGMRILDLCTGSGCIALSLLNYTNGTTAVATDLSEDALEVAALNARALGLEERITLLRGNLFDALEGPAGGAGGLFDLIVTNPPYVRPDVIRTLEPEVLAQPAMALDGGPDGLSFYRRLAAEGARYLKGGGMLLAEIGYDQGGDVRRIFEEAGWSDTGIIRDYGGCDRILTASKSVLGR